MEKCPTCGENYKALGSHWNKADCEYPEYTDRQREILAGILLNRGHIDSQHDRNPQFSFMCRSKEFLNWLRAEYSIQALDIKEVIRDDDPVCYRFRLRRNPNLKEFESWFNGEERQLRRSIHLSPMMAKILFGLGGHLNWRENLSAAGIYISIRPDVSEVLEKLLTNRGFVVSRNSRESSDTIYLKSTEAREFLSWIGGPVPGFEYKWCNKSHEIYQFMSPHQNLTSIAEDAGTQGSNLRL